MPDVKSLLREHTFLYDPDERRRWLAGDGATIDEIQRVTGDLGRGHDTFRNQAMLGQNYPEVRYAKDLIERQGISPGDVFFENYLVCASELTERTPSGTRRSGLKFTNTRKVLSKVFTGAFFEEVERIFGLNPKIMAERSRAHAHVDLCAIDRKSRRCHFVETKIHKSGTGQHEGYAEHQLLFLAAVAHAAEALGSRAFVGEPYEVVPELIVFVGPGEEYRPVSHPVPFVA